MKESVLDILIYLFENYFDGELDERFEPDRDTFSTPTAAVTSCTWSTSGSCRRRSASA